MRSYVIIFFFFNDTATTEIYTLSLHDALPIWLGYSASYCPPCLDYSRTAIAWRTTSFTLRLARSEEHTSELQSRQYLVCRLLLEKKKSQLLYNAINSII